MSASPALPAHLMAIERALRRQVVARALTSALAVGAVLVVAATGLSLAEASNAGSLERGLTRLFDFPSDMLAEALDAGWDFPVRMAHYAPALLGTVNMALVAVLIALPAALVLGCLASRTVVPNALVVGVARRVLDLLRAFPELILALVLLYLLGKGPMPAVIAIALNTVGILGKLFSEAIENVDPDPIAGIRATGAGPVQGIRFGVLPQVMPMLVSYSLMRLEIAVRASTVLGFVGAGGIGQALSTAIQWRQGADVVAIALSLALTITVLDVFSATLRRKLIKGQSGEQS